MTAVAVITGAAGTMGSACARALAPDVDVMLLTDRDTSGLDATAERVSREVQVEVHTVNADLGDPGAVERLAARVDGLGELRSLVHTAGLSPSMAGWREILRVDLVAVGALLDAFLPLVVDGSAAVLLASIAGQLGEFDASMDALLDEPRAPDLEARFLAAIGAEPDPGATYRLAKRAVTRLCERAAVLWGRSGGRVVSLSPGLIDTEMGRLELRHQPIKVWMAELTPVRVNTADGAVLPGRADDVARAVAFLCSDAASFVSGCDLRVDGGLVAAMNHHNDS